MRRVWIGMIGALLAASALSAQDVTAPEDLPQPSPLFLRITIYPTVNLSRYDYNNDLDLAEIRAYVELRDESQAGEVIEDARILVMGEELELKNEHFERRIRVPVDDLPLGIDFRLTVPDGRAIREEIPIPDWLILQSPKPMILDASTNITIRWMFQSFGAPVDINVYDFKSGEQIFVQQNVTGREATLPAELIPESTILRIWVMQSWLSKRFFFGPRFAPGSEILLIPWSQVFIRTR